MRAVISGASGFIGTALSTALRQRGDKVVALQRLDPSRRESWWDPSNGQLDPGLLADQDAVINLSGTSLATRWTEDNLRLARRSRIDSTRLLAESLAGLAHPPSVLINASGLGYYGLTGNAVVTEASPRGEGILADLAADWEAATRPAADAGIRVVRARMAMVLSAGGGALATMLTPFRLGLGGRFGSGSQYLPWISLTDTVRALLHALDQRALSGPINHVAPQAVTNAEFTRALGRALRRPTLVAVPAWLLRLMMGRMADEMLLAGQRAEPVALRESGFEFHLPTVDRALAEALAGGTREEVRD